MNRRYPSAIGDVCVVAFRGMWRIAVVCEVDPADGAATAVGWGDVMIRDNELDQLAGDNSHGGIRESWKPSIKSELGREFATAILAMKSCEAHWNGLNHAQQKAIYQARRAAYRQKPSDHLQRADDSRDPGRPKD